MSTLDLLIAVASLLAGIAIGYGIRKVFLGKALQNAETDASNLIRETKAKAKELLLDAKEQAQKQIDETKQAEQARRKKIEDLEKRLREKESWLEQRVSKIEQAQEKLSEKSESLKKEEEELSELVNEAKTKLSEISSLSKDEARDLVLKKAEEECSEDILARVERIEKEAKAEAQERARWVLAHAIRKYAAEVVSETTVTTVELPSEDMKGRIIGREGRNINAFERATGTDVIVDDSPTTVLISCFDVTRRFVAKTALERLIKDGRIHPTRIEEAVEKAKKELSKMLKEIGEQAVYDAGLTGLHPDLIKLIGRLRFHTTYGQNVLKHSMEVSFLAASMAEEMGADIQVCKKAGFLHDIGRAVSHDISGPHHEIGKDIAKKYGLGDAVAHCIEAHHGDTEFKSIEAVIVQAANDMSNARPGATNEQLETHVKRLTDLENVAKAFEGVKEAYVVQAGKEIKVVVDPEVINDLEALKLAKDIASKIENDLQYPGQVKVHVLRQTRVIDFAR